MAHYLTSEVAPGKTAPDFEAHTASGPLRYHRWAKDSWSVLFSHPGTSFPLELLEVARQFAEFDKRNIKVIGVSGNWLDDQKKWKASQVKYGMRIGTADKTVQIVADDAGEIASIYGMINEEDPSAEPHTVFVVDPKRTIRLALAYPATLRKNVDKILQFIDKYSSTDEINMSSFNLDSSGRGKIYTPELTRNQDNTTLNAAADVLSLGNTVDITLASIGIYHASTRYQELRDADATADYVDNAIKLLDNLSELGKVVPFVAPAFILLKVIVDVEKNARDVDAKCRDLVLRVTFMLSHLPALANLPSITPSSPQRQVINQMNSVLKETAALIEAYRNQGALARRLSLRNKDKFERCAKDLANTTKDLMMSLQIHQSVQIDTILQRSVPQDPEDEKAKRFVERYGAGDEGVVKADKALLKQFAEELKLGVEDEAIEALNTNLGDLLREHQAQLEHRIDETIRASLTSKEVDMEQTLICVQCEKEFKQSNNHALACSFHKAEYDSWSRSYKCCGTPHPCQFKAHRAKHHSDYPYGPFFPYVRGITGYTDTTSEWANVEDFNLESDVTQSASISRLLKWKSRGAAPEKPTILIRVGWVYFKDAYYFGSFTKEDLDLQSRVIEITRQTVIFRSAPSDSEYAMVEWVTREDGGITGVRLTAKVATALTPFIRVCLFDTEKMEMSGEVMCISEGGLRSYTPLSAYSLPQSQRVSAELPETAKRPARKDFKTRTTPRLPVVIKEVVDAPLRANPNMATQAADYFHGAVSVFNKHPPGTNNPISISEVKVEWRLVGDQEYKPVKSFTFLDGTKLPLTIDPRETWALQFQVAVPRSEEDAQLGVRWWERAFVARRRPLRLKVTFVDIEDEEASLVLEWVYTPFKQEKREDGDIAFIYIDDPLLFERHSLHVKPLEKEGYVLEVEGRDISVRSLQKAVYRAMKTGESEVDIEVGQKRNTGEMGEWEWKTWALVDTSCRRVYAFKILISQPRDGKGYACLEYLPCPDYGDVMSETRAVRYAVEKVGMPTLEGYSEEDIPWDDEFDDAAPEINHSQPSLANSSGVTPMSATMVVPAEVNQRLASIDANLERIATAFEQLLEIMKSRSNV
ncbi:1-cys peroxiredoxin [Moniliophthora roreri MCA 2997]|uniref:1-cys peroxiredoxin n=2 Tax=Moniliophthora roreri TaxID=221103 RepID=V2X8U2_MONRO|nr:1-cys peroxiredoxin [Moniliophthora roreri MCA 2997]KAI3610048.1 1-cys peroxiredoxin [Moniliophthora roreri]